MPFNFQLARPNQITILAGQTNGPATMMRNQADYFLVYLAAQHHLDHVHGLGISDTHALHKLTFLANLFQQPANLRTTAMYHDRVYADQLH